MVVIVVPLIVLERLGLDEAVVGVMFAISGIAGMASALYFGRIDTRGREYAMLVVPMASLGPAFALLLAAAGATEVAFGLVAMTLSMVFYGLLNGPLDIALFTVRQRRTDPAWMGRAFAVSMALNFAGFPIGAALAGILAATSIELAIVVGVGACLLSGLIGATMIPRRDPAEALA
jgi:predicted MFS family arabinose efflux permease